MKTFRGEGFRGMYSGELLHGILIHRHRSIVYIRFCCQYSIDYTGESHQAGG